MSTLPGHLQRLRSRRAVANTPLENADKRVSTLYGHVPRHLIKRKYDQLIIKNQRMAFALEQFGLVTARAEVLIDSLKQTLRNRTALARYWKQKCDAARAEQPLQTQASGSKF